MRVAGHGLRFEGRVLTGWRYGAGTGKGVCECGAESPVLSTIAARQRWHKEHKAEVLMQADAQRRGVSLAQVRSEREAKA